MSRKYIYDVSGGKRYLNSAPKDLITTANTQAAKPFLFPLLKAHFINSLKFYLENLRDAIVGPRVARQRRGPGSGAAVAASRRDHRIQAGDMS